MSEIKLLPCPFCGGEAEYSEHHEDNGGVEVYYREYHYYMVCCDKCHLTFTSTLDKEDVVRRWNTRKSMKRIVERLEEYREESEQFGVSGMFTDMMEAVKEEGADDEL